MSGWSELGAMMGGGDGARQMQLRQYGMDAGSRQANMLEEARARRDKNLGLQQITPQAIASATSGADPITGQPFDPAAASAIQGGLVSAMFHAGIDPRQLSGYQKDQQGVRFSNDAMTAALDPSVSDDSLNRRMIVIGGKPVDLTKVEGDVAFNPMATPGAQTINATPVGLADIMLKGSQSHAADAAAGEHAAHAKLFDTQTAAGGFNPHAGSAAAGGADAELLTPDAQALVSAALSHGYTIPLPNFGFGARGSQAKADALNTLAQTFKTQNVSPDDAVSSMINGKTATAGLTDIQRSSAKVNAWENSAARQADITLELSRKVDRTGVPLFNKWLLAGRQGTGDVDVAQFNNGVNTLAEEYARVMGGGNATATDSTRDLAHTMLNSAMTNDQFEGVVNLMKREMATRKGALHESVGQQRQAIVAPASLGGMMGVPSASDPASASPAAPSSPFRAVNPQTGHAVVWNGSAWVPEQ